MCTRRHSYGRDGAGGWLALPASAHRALRGRPGRRNASLHHPTLPWLAPQHVGEAGSDALADYAPDPAQTTQERPLEAPQRLQVQPGVVRPLPGLVVLGMVTPLYRAGAGAIATTLRQPCRLHRLSGMMESRRT